MKKSNAAFLQELSFEEKRILMLAFLEFTIRNDRFELDTDPTGLTADQMEPIFTELQEQVSNVKTMTDSARNNKGLSAGIKDFLTVLRRGQKENSCRRLNYFLKLSLPSALFAKLYDGIGIPLENIVFDKALLEK